MGCGVGGRRGSHLLLLWHKPEATAPIQPLGWEPPYAMGAALEKDKKKKYAHTHTYTYIYITLGSSHLGPAVNKSDWHP